MIEEIKNENKLLSIIIRSNYSCEGIKFFTPDDFSQQLGYMSHSKGSVIKPHTHNKVTRNVNYTKEVLIIRSGKVRVDFYSDARSYIRSTVLYKGDVILLAFGGHGFEMLEDSEMIEIKQGPYAGEADKSRFDPVEESQLKFE